MDKITKIYRIKTIEKHLVNPVKKLFLIMSIVDLGIDWSHIKTMTDLQTGPRGVNQ
jgi:hypothetical protein